MDGVPKQPTTGDQGPSGIFSESYQENRVFSGIPASDAHGCDIEFYRCRFEGCQFPRGLFQRCRFEECVFERCDLSLLKIPDSRWNNVRFLRSKMLGIDWTQAAKPLSLAFQSCNLNHSLFIGLSLQKMEMVACVAHEIDFSNANLTKANLSQTDFLGSRFSNTNLSQADLTHAVAYAIDPVANRLKKAKFSLPEVLSLLAAFDIDIQ